MEKTRILVVDDEQLIRWSIEQNLKKQGYDVTIAENGEVALRLVSEEQPDLILLDIQMPGISGLEVLERVKETDEDIVVSWLPPRGGAGDSRQCHAAGGLRLYKQAVQFR
jgi:CheY-like chemotaxis protein